MDYRSPIGVGDKLLGNDGEEIRSAPSRVGKCKEAGWGFTFNQVGASRIQHLWGIMEFRIL